MTLYDWWVNPPWYKRLWLKHFGKRPTAETMNDIWLRAYQAKENCRDYIVIDPESAAYKELKELGYIHDD